MRLTLRTLLAWLDDTLPPAQVREIGKQVAESPFAQELVERIHRVCRQRRLTVPSRTGPEGTDPNVVAGYVDNDLDPEQLTEYEKKCLTSDVNLAETACVHQILSLLGQKVHVPPEAKARMAQLVKGRESIPKPRLDGVKPRPPEPVTKPIQPWVAPEPPPRLWIERFGPALACLALIAILCWSAYQSLTPPAPESTTLTVSAPTASAPKPEPAAREPQVEAAKGQVAPEPQPESEPVAARAMKSEVPGPTPAGPEPAAVEPTKTADATKPKPEEKAAPKAVPAGAVGVVDRTSGILIRFNIENREWERIAEGTALASGDHLICLAPFQARILIGTAPIRLHGESQVRILSKVQAEPVFELIFGRVVLERSPTAGPVRVEYAGRGLVLERGSAASVGLERLAAWTYGQAVTQPATLAVHLADGDLTLALDQAKQALNGPGTILADAAGRLQTGDSKAVPEWLTATEPSEKDQKLGEAFARQFSRDGHVLADIVSATENESPVTKKFAVQGVKALGDLSFLTPILSRAKDPSARESAAAALREFLAQGPDAVKRLGEPLSEEFGAGPARVIQKLLIGYAPEEAAKKETLDRLVDHLSPREPSLAVRELALENLKRISGKGDQGYDPDNPDDKSFAAWKGLLNRGELKPAARRKPAA
jgi:hypothetical protein